MGRFFKISLAIFLAVSFLLGLVLLTLPASVAYKIGSNRLPAGVQFKGIEGSIWSGRAAQLEIKGVSLGQLSWQIDKTSPLVAQVALEGPEVRATGSIALRERGIYEARNLVVDAPARLLEKALGLPGFEFTGALSGNLKNAVITPTYLSAGGEIIWTDAGLTLPFGVRLGTYVLALEPTPNGARGTISDRGGDLAVAGTVEWTGFRYRASVRLQARSGPPELARALSYIGVANADGSRQLQIDGDLL